MNRDTPRHRRMARLAAAGALVGLSLLVAPPTGAHDVAGITLPTVPSMVPVTAPDLTLPPLTGPAGVTVPPVSVTLPPVTVTVTLPPTTLPPLTLPALTVPPVTLPDAPAPVGPVGPGAPTGAGGGATPSTPATPSGLGVPAAGGGGPGAAPAPLVPAPRASGLERQAFGRAFLTSAVDFSLPFTVAVLVVVHLVVGGGRVRDERLTEAPLGVGDVVEFR